MNHVFLINSYAVKDKIETVKNFIKETMGETPYELRFSEYVGHLEKIASECKDSILYSVGGDGSLLEVVNGAAETSNAICVVPAGSGNDFCRVITKEKSYEKILLNRKNYTIKSVDCGKANEKYFANIASVGFDAESVANAEKFKKIPFFRKFSYILSIFHTLFTYKGFAAKITVDGSVYNQKFLLCAFANGQYYGGGIRITPTATIDDGLLDVYLIDAMSMFRVFTLLPKLTNGSHVNLPCVHKIKAENISIESDKPFLLNLDGDLFEKSFVEISVVKNGLNIFS